MAVTKNHITIEILRRKGLLISKGSKYIPKAWLPKKPVSLAEVRRRLSKIKGSLSQTIAEIRDEE